MSPADVTTQPSLLRALADPADHPAWVRFVERYRPLIDHWCRRWAQPAEVDDVAAKVLGRLAEALPAFAYDAARGGFRAWLYTLVRNLAIDHQDAVARRRDVPSAGLHRHPDPASLDAASDDLSQRIAADLDRAHRLVDGLLRSNRLSAQNWRIFQHYWLRGRPAAEVARENGVSQPSVYQRCYRVAVLLRREGERQT